MDAAKLNAKPTTFRPRRPEAGSASQGMEGAHHRRRGAPRPLGGERDRHLRAIASSYIKGKVKNKYPQAQNVSVSVSAFPAIRLAFKDYSSLDVKVSGITIEGINFRTIELKSNKWPNGTYTAVGDARTR